MDYINELNKFKEFINHKIDLICSNEEYFDLYSARCWLPKFKEHKDLGKQQFKQSVIKEISTSFGVQKIKVEYKYAEYLCTRFNITTTIEKW